MLPRDKTLPINYAYAYIYDISICVSNLWRLYKEANMSISVSYYSGSYTYRSSSSTTSHVCHFTAVNNMFSTTSYSEKRIKGLSPFQAIQASTGSLRFKRPQRQGKTICHSLRNKTTLRTEKSSAPKAKISVQYQRLHIETTWQKRKKKKTRTREKTA